MLSRAGIVSSSVAYHLARRGVPVTLLEQEPAPATGVTGDSFAWISSSASDRPGGLRSRESATDVHHFGRRHSTPGIRTPSESLAVVRGSGWHLPAPR
ncbi:FAD-dependent oxidoreductase [Streptomyces sp. NPDC058441]|uniref:FAD-dependent oxidoreductase n=1 Tax=Streptomyces sp. NPDC058441 TaxID=3346502 RepID=UPI00365F1C6E